MATKNIQNAFEDEVFFSLTRQRNSWAIVAIISIILAIVAVGAIIALLPLKESKPYVVLVDKATGVSEKIVEVAPVSMSEQEAVVQAELVSYVADRELYDRADNVSRITSVMERSTDQAANSLAVQWRSTSGNYPPTIYGDSRVRVYIKSISFLPVQSGATTRVAQIRFYKTREQAGRRPVTKHFEATLTFSFQPKVSGRLEDVWKNPLGFTVHDYRLDVEASQGEEINEGEPITN